MSGCRQTAPQHSREVLPSRSFRRGPCRSPSHGRPAGRRSGASRRRGPARRAGRSSDYLRTGTARTSGPAPPVRARSRCRTPAAGTARQTGAAHPSWAPSSPGHPHHRADDEEAPDARVLLQHRLRVRQGLYDPAYEHDACGVGAVADVHGRRATPSSPTRSTCCTTSTTAARRASNRPPETARHPAPAPRRAAARTCRLRAPRAAALADGGAPVLASPPASRSCPPAPTAAPRRCPARALAAEEGLDVLGWREVPVDPDGADVGSDGARAIRTSPVRRRHPRPRHRPGDRPRPAGLVVRKRAERHSRRGGQRASTSRRCRAAPSPTRAC